MQIHDHVPNAWGRSFLWGGLVLGLLLVAAFLTHGFGLMPAAAPAPEPVMLLRQGDKIVIPASSPLRKRVAVEPARAEEVGAKLVLPGVVESDPARTAAVLTPLGGRVLEIKVALGDRVRQGQVLALIDSPDLGQAYDDNEKAADTVQLTRKNLERQAEQLKLGTVSTRDLDQARSDNTQAVAEYSRTLARLRTLGVPEQRRPHSTLLAVTAPVSGSVTALAIARGNMINDPTQPIMTVADLGTVWITAMVPEKDIAVVARDLDADVTLAAYPGRVLHGKVLFVSDVIEPDSRRDKVRIAFANADTSLKPNMFATVTILGPKRSRVVLPTSALLMNNDRTSVFIATAPWTFERRTIEAQLEEGTTIALDSGVQPGEQVVVKGGILLND
ncbi:MAG TPA: efflux RND transporter periplasmic adaptor subunit [Steroidobacteraceae bacterium]|nr:efflux RND transporter periplasmic adaptor subunit [Steroidobacteraceae bacterium]